VSAAHSVNRWQPYCDRYQGGEWRDRIFRDMILEDALRLHPRPTLLDIGCGKGFDTDIPLQQSLVRAAGRYIGIEPDSAVAPGDYLPEIHRCLLEQAPLAPASVDVAFAVMVLEHVPKPQPFWNKIHEILRPDGVFWGFTMDARHWFCAASLFLDRLQLKDLYLTYLLGRRGSQRYENYPVHYRCNTPAQMSRYARRFRSCECINFARVGQINNYFPRALRGLASLVDRWSIARRQPGTLLAVRAVK
jgi:SAM-dependent methyltransferase